MGACQGSRSFRRCSVASKGSFVQSSISPAQRCAAEDSNKQYAPCAPTWMLLLELEDDELEELEELLQWADFAEALALAGDLALCGL